MARGTTPGLLTSPCAQGLLLQNSLHDHGQLQRRLMLRLLLYRRQLEGNTPLFSTRENSWTVLMEYVANNVYESRACILTIMVCVLPLLVTPYANMVPLMPSIEDWTTLLLVLAYTYTDRQNCQACSQYADA